MNQLQASGRHLATQDILGIWWINIIPWQLGHLWSDARSEHYPAGKGFAFQQYLSYGCNHLREQAGRGCQHPPAHPAIGILGYPRLSGKDRRWEAVRWHPGQELNRSSPRGHSPFLRVLVFRLCSQDVSRDTRTALGRVLLGLMVGWGLLTPGQPHWGTQRMAKQTARVNHSPRRVGPDTCMGCVGEKVFGADTGTCACWAVRATHSPELPKTLPKCFINANTC